ncbi:hypothetical protein CDL15_Pgr006551 [Punica granatum]|uniref:Tyrosine specific protein phosphatases domain-containing protein n=1 Tax=Punica granatum TaxID=22663 RepID=A0A218XZJ7_PUNGR|nr:hypothetical protein CDL15_Pgr006551 [Punica granatum]
MIVAMDLNAMPEEEEETYDRHVQEYTAAIDHTESAVNIANRESFERSKRPMKECSEERATSTSQRADQFYQTTRRFKSYDTAKLPSGWLDCPSFGQEIDCFIPSKVPLGEAFNDSIPPGKRYSFKQVIHQHSVLGRKLGLVIDLTNTTCYYSVSDLNKEGIKHVKISCVGRDAVPNSAQVNQFVYEVSLFLSRQNQTKKYILVHRTHGHNRTGYMIIHYLMRSTSMSVTQAIKKFADARPPGIYKPDYIDALYTYYHEKKPRIIICPPTPEWKRSSDLDLNCEAMADEDDDGNHAAPILDNCETEAQMTNDDVLGEEVPRDLVDRYRYFCYQTLKLNTQGVREKTHHYTLLDGEMVIDTMPDSGTQERRYLIYDLMALNQVRRKGFWLLPTVDKLLKDFIPKLSHEADGLIFQGWDDPYVPRTHEGLLKWKYPEMNSVDFLFEVMQSIRDNITEDVLLGEIGEIVCLPMRQKELRLIVALPATCQKKVNTDREGPNKEPFRHPFLPGEVDGFYSASDDVDGGCSASSKLDKGEGWPKRLIRSGPSAPPASIFEQRNKGGGDLNCGSASGIPLFLTRSSEAL